MASKDEAFMKLLGDVGLVPMTGQFWEYNLPKKMLGLTNEIFEMHASSNTSALADNEALKLYTDICQTILGENKTCPEKQWVAEGAQWAVSRERILQHPKELYQKAVDLGEGYEDKFRGLVLEALWPTVWGAESWTPTDVELSDVSFSAYRHAFAGGSHCALPGGSRAEVESCEDKMAYCEMRSRSIGQSSSTQFAERRQFYQVSAKPWRMQAELRPLLFGASTWTSLPKTVSGEPESFLPRLVESGDGYLMLPEDGQQQGIVWEITEARPKLICAFRPQSMAEVLQSLAEEGAECESDVYGQSLGLQAFEDEVAALLGKPAALFFATGSLANVTALKVHGARRAILHPTSHLAHHDCLTEAATQRLGAAASASQMLPQELSEPAFVGNFSKPLHPSDFEDFRWAAKDCLVMELPQRMNGGATPSWESIVSICQEAKKQGASRHMDGARLWEVQAFYTGRSLAELAGQFDSVYVSFYKGLGAMNGAMLAGSPGFVAEARLWRQRLGGTLRSFSPHWLHCRLQLRSVLPSQPCPGFLLFFPERLARLQHLVAMLSAQQHCLADVVRFDPPKPEACLVHVYLALGGGSLEALQEAHEEAASTSGWLLWDRLRGPGHSRKGEVYFEWSLGPHNAAIPDHEVLAAWQALAAVLRQRSTQDTKE
ncbi:unnamed protein product [Polarella glacialis]|uniref:Aromatic amino acid beta-eliminating lyase/threonine aldolase domain-containing protein n=1 Tax=Polarella glacialis TaxID=89957 RepID=A0A813HQZ5_POLGL|nr:unnamed protein product [Polarella glacialis]